MNRDEFVSAYDLTDRVAIVTGGSRGLGLAAAEALAGLGAKVAVASRSQEACETAARRIRDAGGEAIAIAAHLGKLDQVAALAQRTVSCFGGIDIIINNAANPLALPIGEITPTAWEKSFAVNLAGPVFLVQDALPYLRRSSHASIVNVLTAGIFGTGSGISLYAAGKSALAMMTRAMAAELAPDGIRANAVAPGSMDTDMFRASSETIRQAVVSAQLIKRI